MLSYVPNVVFFSFGIGLKYLESYTATYYAIYFTLTMIITLEILILREMSSIIIVILDKLC